MKCRRSQRVNTTLFRHSDTSSGSSSSSSSSSSANSSACSIISTNLKRKKRNFTSLKNIRNSLSHAIENEMVDKVKEILNKFEICKSKRRKISHIYKKIENFDQSIDIDQDLNSNVLHTNHNNNYVTTKTITRRITWASFCVDEENKDNPLHYACRLGKTCLIDVLLDTGHFDINEPNYSYDLDTCLTIACDEGQIDTAKILIARGADLNYENRKSKTPLILATELIHPCDAALVKILLNNGALVNKTTSNGNTVLLSASKFGNIELINMLLYANANLNWEYNDGASPLMRACYYNHPNLVKYFIERGADIESKNLRKETPLYIASFRGYLNIVKILVENGANVNNCDIDGDTPLSVACYEEKTNVITYLLRHGALVNKHGIRGDTPLHIAVSNCTNQTVIELIEMGARVDALNFQNETPLHIVTRQNRFEILKTLLNYAQNLDICSFFNKRTPFKNLMDDIQIDKLNMGIILVRSGCDVNLGYNQFHFNCFDTFRPSNSIYRSYAQTIYSQTFNVINAQESPFKYLFRISKSNFKFVNNLQNPRTNLPVDEINNNIILPFNQYSTFRSYINLIEFIFRAGYRANQNDSQAYRDSWLFSYLNTFKCTTSLENKTKHMLDYYFIHNINKTYSLMNLCKFKIRSCLTKPINKSINVLNIPHNLKCFLNLDSVEIFN